MTCYTAKHKVPFEIDEDDWNRIKGYTWRELPCGYIATVVGIKNCGKYRQKTVYLHKMIMDAPSGFQVDHIDGNRKNNNKSNLRICTGHQNVWNRKKQKGSSKYKGVSWHGWNKTWMAGIRHNNKKIFLGYFKIEEEAARAYDEKAVELFGEFARTNVMEGLLNEQ